MAALRDRLSSIPKGSAALFFIQIFATLGFAVFYSTLVLYATRHLGFSARDASAIMGVFGAFNYGLHLFVGSSRVDLQACKLEYSIVSPK